jgi:DNA-binding NarL/FixJ family response regulator
MIRILLADSHDLTFLALKHLFEKQPASAFSLFLQVTEYASLLTALSEEKVDVIIVDYNSLPDFGYDECEQIIQQYPSVKIMLLTADQDRDRILRMIQSGVHAFLRKGCRSKEILYALEMVKDNQKFFCNTALDLLTGTAKINPDQPTITSSFSMREYQIIELIALDLSTQEIADRLMLSPHTIHAHRKKILKKLGVCSPVGLLTRSLSLGILEVEDGKIVLNNTYRTAGMRNL